MLNTTLWILRSIIYKSPTEGNMYCPVKYCWWDITGRTYRLVERGVAFSPHRGLSIFHVVRSTCECIIFCHIFVSYIIPRTPPLPPTICESNLAAHPIKMQRWRKLAKHWQTGLINMECVQVPKGGHPICVCVCVSNTSASTLAGRQNLWPTKLLWQFAINVLMVARLVVWSECQHHHQVGVHLHRPLMTAKSHTSCHIAFIRATSMA